MKIWMTIVFAAVLGITCGVGQAWWQEMRQDAEVFAPFGEIIRRANQLPPAPDPGQDPEAGEPEGPRLEVVDGPSFDFGKMRRYTTRSHTFTIRNTGTEPLELNMLRTTCKCTLSEVANGKVAPGETTEVTLEWSAKEVGDATDFSQTAEIQTNDPEVPLLRLTIRGLIVDVVRLHPEQVVVREISGNEPTQVEFRLFAYTAAQPEIAAWHLAKPEHADKFRLEFERLPEEAWKKEKGATGGLLGKLTIEPGLPLGPLSETIELSVEAEETFMLELPITGNVASDILLSGSQRFNRDHNILDLGSVSSRDGITETIYFFVKGPYRDETRVSVARIEPEEYLQVRLSEPEAIGGGKTIKYRLDVTIPPNLPPINRLGTRIAKLGKILLESTHPLTKEIPIAVRFSVIP